MELRNLLVRFRSFHIYAGGKEVWNSMFFEGGFLFSDVNL